MKRRVPAWVEPASAFGLGVGCLLVFLNCRGPKEVVLADRPAVGYITSGHAPKPTTGQSTPHEGLIFTNGAESPRLINEASFWQTLLAIDRRSHLAIVEPGAPLGRTGQQLRVLAWTNSFDEPFREVGRFEFGSRPDVVAVAWHGDSVVCLSVDPQAGERRFDEFTAYQFTVNGLLANSATASRRLEVDGGGVIPRSEALTLLLGQWRTELLQSAADAFRQSQWGRTLSSRDALTLLANSLTDVRCRLPFESEPQTLNLRSKIEGSTVWIAASNSPDAMTLLQFNQGKLRPVLRLKALEGDRIFDFAWCPSTLGIVAVVARWDSGTMHDLRGQFRRRAVFVDVSTGTPTQLGRAGPGIAAVDLINTTPGFLRR